MGTVYALSVRRGGATLRTSDRLEDRLDTASLLRQVTIFRELPAEVLADLAGRVRPRPAEAGSVIVSAEEPGDALFLIAKGKVKVVLYGETGRAIILSILRGADFFGDMRLLDRQ